ncbi:MAG: hypothetical protein Q8O19_08055, partial [Rectinemataceae bacterium]|nr:hypothetical protein [Rectinemataceae bacterium]
RVRWISGAAILRKNPKNLSSYDTANLIALSGKLVGERLEFTGNCQYSANKFVEKEINMILEIFLPRGANAYWMRRENVNSGTKYKRENARINFYNIHSD